MAYHYTESGLDYVYLENGYEEHETDYGPGVSFKAADTLDRAIAFHILVSPARLGGQEVRFLRALLDLTQLELANKLGVTRVTIARWESDMKSKVSGTADRLLRVLYFTHKMGWGDGEEDLTDGVTSLMTVVSTLEEIGSLKRQPIRMVYAPDLEEDTLPMPELHGEETGWKKQAA